MNSKLLILVSFLLCLIVPGWAVNAGNGLNSVSLSYESDTAMVLDFEINTYQDSEIVIKGETYHLISLSREGVSQEKGKPQLPVLNRSIIIPAQSGVNLTVTDVHYRDIPLQVAPSKGVIYRNQDPEAIPYTFDKLYQNDSFYPSEIATLSSPFIMRDLRGITIQTSPMAYNPVTKTLRIYTHYSVRIAFSGMDMRNVLQHSPSRINSSFQDIYSNFFVNYYPQRYTSVDEYGKLLVICPAAYLSTIAPYVNWKRQKGIATELVDISTIGSTSTALSSYILNRYTADPDLAYVQLVGDAATMPTPSAAGGSSDPSYALVAGADAYPDIFIGRFSCESVTDLQTQINRSIAYERDLTTGATWLSRGTCIASNEGGSGTGDNGESDQVHQENIRTNLLNYGYTSVDQMYQANGVTIAQLSTAFNNGRGLINYTGHGSQTSWGTTGFSNTNVAALTNENMLPLVVSVACVNGQFDGATCFAEAWMRSQRNSNPIGAIAFWGSSINQSWNPPMLAQDEVNYLMINEQKHSVGSLLYNGACKMIEVYGTDGQNMYKTWHIFGDASLMYRSKLPAAMNVTYPAQLSIGQTTITVNTGVANALVAVSGSNTLYGSAYCNASGAATLNLTGLPAIPGTMTVTVTAFNRVTHVGTLQLVSTNGAYINIQSVDFGDANNNLAEYNESGLFSVQYQNVGTLSSGALVSSISSTSGYVTITDATQSLASIAAGASYTATNAFAFTLGNAIPDQTVIPFSFDTTSGTESWQGSYNLTVNAPALALGSVTISEVSGNGNGRLDPGETADLMISVYNTGHAVSPAGSLTLSCPTSGITIQQTSAAVLALSAGSSVSTSFRIQTAAGMAVGTIAAFTFNVMAGNYTATRNENINIGLLIEDFESGGFGSFDWQLSGNVNWGTVNSGAYAGSYCAKSGIITHSQSSNLQLSLSLPASGNISFYYKVSSEGSYDFLTFYIDGVQQGSWSGEIGWTQISYPVTAGTHIFKWTYAKDSIVSSGSDCAWLDNVIFPSGATAPLYPPQNLTASAGNGLVSLSWQAPLSGSPTGYQVFRNDVNITTTPVTGLSYTDAFVTNEQTYTYYLKAVYAGGISPAGNSVTAMPTAAQSVLVAIGTGTSSQSYPIDRYYNYSTHEAIYLASELGSAGNLTKIAYYKSSGTDLNSISAVSIYLKHTTATTLTSGTYALTDYTQVYSGSFPNTSASGWMEVSFNTPFAYNGSSHLSVLIVKGYQAYISTYPSWRYTASTTRSRMARSDSAQPSSLTASAYLPNVRFTKLVNTTPQPVISVTPAQLSYSQYQAQITNQTVTLSNTGTANLSWQLSARESRPAGWLSVNPASGNIAAGANQTLNVTVNTAGMTSGSYSTAVTLSSNASNAALLNIPVSLTVIAAPTSPRMVAEYEPMQGALIRYPLGIPYSIVRELAESSKVYTIVADAATRTTALSNYQANGVNTANCEFIIASTESYWTRDYGPWYVYDADNQLKIVDFTYNRPRPGDDAVPIAVGTYLGQTVYPLSVSHTGGNIMTDGYGVAASTNLVLSENSTQTQQQINTQMSAYLGIDDYRLYEDPNNTYIDHIDCWGKYLDADKVLIRSVPVAHPQYAQIEAVAAQFAAGTSSYGTPYRVFRVYTPNDEPYTNSFIFNNKILVPQMATANDAAALAVYRSAMPGYEVLGYTAGANAWASTDAIHCRINAIPEPDQVHITHSAIQNPVTHQSYTIIADIDCNNPLIADSVYVMWKTHWQQNWRKVRLNFDGTIWSKTMPMLQYGDSLYYYLHAVDNTGKAANLPLCAGLDPFRMAVSSQTELDIAVSLDTVSGMLNIIWSPVPWANSYRIYGSSSADGEYQLIGTATTNSWHHLISDADSSRYFRVTASTDIVWGD